MTIFEITGETVTGGRDDSHNGALLDRVKGIEGFAQEIGKSLGMATVDSVVVTTEEDGYGFRFASTSAEAFDAKGVEMEGESLPSDLIEKLK